MTPQDDSPRDFVRLPAERWAAESPFVGEAVAKEEQAPIHPWYRGYTPFVEDRELEEMYAPEAEWEAHLMFKDEFAFEEPGIIAGENRVRVKKTYGVPWRWICKISIKDNQGRYSTGGTGVLISHRHVLTAAHVVYPEHIDPYNYSVEVTPALNEGDEPFGTYSLSAKPKIPKNYDPKAHDQLDWDYALITLKDRVGKKTFSNLSGGPLCYWGHPTCGANTIFVRPEPRTLNGKAVLTAGYPMQKGGKQLWCAAGILHSADQRRRKMGITADTTRGQSGSPVWVVENGRYCLVGIAAGAGQQTNFVVRVTRELIRQLRAWITEDGEPPYIIETEEALETPALSYPETFEDFDDAEFGDDEFEDDAESFYEDIDPELAEEVGHPGDVSPQFEEQVPFTLPAGLSPLPNDAALQTQLQAIGTAEARALDPAFARFGKRDVFAAALERAVRAMPEPTGTTFGRLRTHLVRLGVEAFVLDVSIPTSWQSHIGFTDHPRRLHDLLTKVDQEKYLHFAVRRLLEISFLPSTPDIDRRQMDRAAVLLRVFQAELASEYRLIIDSEAVLLAYRTLLVQIVWKHYQALLDRVLAAAAKSRLRWSVVDKEWEKDLETASSTTRVPDERALIPTFRLTPTLYRDYFNPAAATDIGYKHFTTTPAPVTSPETSFRAVFRRRVEQMAFIKYLRDEWASDPLPRLHDSASWQAWVRKTWDKPLLRREDKLAVILGYVSRYFGAFTIHTPYDLREGCSEKNYLTRVFPRAVTGSLVHDCFVYALRWLHILGGLLTPGSTPSGLAKPRIFLIEMPAHVGVMIRAEALFLGKPVDIVISINNKHAEVRRFDSVETDEFAARTVVQDMYQGMMTPFAIRRLTSKPSNATALWNEVCKISEKKLALPYEDPSEPHLRYLRHNAEIARISREVSDAAEGLWLALQQKLGPAKDRSSKAPTARVIAEIGQYATSIEKMVKAASDKHAKDVKPLIAQINDDLRANQKRLAKGVLVVDTTPTLLPWEAALINYRPELKRAIQSGDLSGIHPGMFFPEDDFAAAVD